MKLSKVFVELKVVLLWRGHKAHEEVRVEVGIVSLANSDSAKELSDTAEDSCCVDGVLDLYR